MLEEAFAREMLMPATRHRFQWALARCSSMLMSSLRQQVFAMRRSWLGAMAGGGITFRLRDAQRARRNQ